MIDDAGAGDMDSIPFPTIDRLTAMPHKQALEWCGRNARRIETLQKAKGRKDGWTYHLIEATRGKADADKGGASAIESLLNNSNTRVRGDRVSGSGVAILDPIMPQLGACNG